MKDKRKIFKKAMSDVEEEGYSCNCLGFAIAPDDCMDPERVAAVMKYRAMFGFGYDNDDVSSADHFLLAVDNQENKDVFGLRILLLGFACEAWSDVGL